MKSPSEVLAEDVGIMRAYELIAALRAANYIIVPKGAIGRAQDDAVREYKEGALPAYKEPGAKYVHRLVIAAQ